MSSDNQFPNPENSWRDFKVVGYDKGEKGGDYTVRSVFRKPGKIRKFLRRHGIDRSTWEYKLIEMRTTLGGSDE